MLRNQIGQQTNASVIHGDKRLIQHPQRGVAQSQSLQGDAPFLSLRQVAHQLLAAPTNAKTVQ